MSNTLPDTVQRRISYANDIYLALEGLKTVLHDLNIQAEASLRDTAIHIDDISTQLGFLAQDMRL